MAGDQWWRHRHPGVPLGRPGTGGAVQPGLTVQGGGAGLAGHGSTPPPPLHLLPWWQVPTNVSDRDPTCGAAQCRVQHQPAHQHRRRRPARCPRPDPGWPSGGQRGPHLPVAMVAPAAAMVYPASGSPEVRLLGHPCSWRRAPVRTEAPASDAAAGKPGLRLSGGGPADLEGDGARSITPAGAAAKKVTAAAGVLCGDGSGPLARHEAG